MISYNEDCVQRKIEMLKRQSDVLCYVLNILSLLQIIYLYDKKPATLFYIVLNFAVQLQLQDH